MGDFRNKNSFEKAFKKHVYNFDETKMWFEYTKRGMGELNICFVWNNKLRKFPMWKSQFEIDTWGNHFIEFFKTGEFDYNAYWQIYVSRNKKDISSDNVIGEVLKFPLCNDLGNEFYEHSEELSNYLDNYRKKNGDCGIKLVAKPL